MINKNMSTFIIRAKFCIVAIFLMSLSSDTFCQIQQRVNLANEYFNAGEFEKAADMYEKLYNENNKNTSFFNRYIQCLIETKALDKAEKTVRDELKKQPGQVVFHVTLGQIYERQGEKVKSNTEFNKAVEKITADQNIIVSVASAFTNLAKYDYAIKAYLKGEKETKIPYLFTYNLAELYRRNGDVPNMIRYNLLSLSKENTQPLQIQTNLQRYLQEDDYKELQSQLYQLIQEFPNNSVYSEMLEWTFITRKEYVKALKQAKALDRQLNENGGRVFNLAQIAYSDDDYGTAAEAFKYISENYPVNSAYYLESRRGLLNSRKAIITKKFDYTLTDLEALKKEYLDFFELLGRNAQTAQLMIEYATFEGFYLHNLPAAIEVLEALLQFGSVSTETTASAKIALADFYLMNGERWEASLLYSQVDKDFKDGVLGEKARYQNAKLSYYAGDFEWAQEQFKILKGATSKLISNDAIDMSVFILDNLGLDTTEVTLQMFASADLLIFQNKFDEALQKLDSVSILFPEHSLEDDVLYQKAQIFKKLRKIDKVVPLFEKITETYKEEIKADNALFELAEIYETVLNDKEKAKMLYEKLFIDYSGSTFAVEARKRFRILRGDEI